MKRHNTFPKADLGLAATSKMKHFVIIVNDWKPLTIITKRSISDVAAALDPPLLFNLLNLVLMNFLTFCTKLIPFLVGLVVFCIIS